MREIKFRAWDGEEMWHGDLSSSIWTDGTVQYNLSKYMQYTGLKDAKGHEIYEGDVISDHVGSGCVQYVDYYGAFRVNYFGTTRAKWFYDYILKGERESIEIIGNIYENPELLEEKK